MPVRIAYDDALESKVRIQLLTPDVFQNRVVAVHNALASSLIRGFSYMLGGVIAAIGSARITFGVAGVGVLATILLALPWLLPYARLRASATRASPTEMP